MVRINICALCTVLFFLVGCDQSIRDDAGVRITHSTTGGNPLIDEGSADPSVRVFGDRVYIYPSHDYSRDNDFWIMKNWKVYSTADLVNVTDHGVVLSGTEITWAKEPDHCWAPDCIEKNGRYYFYFPLSDVRGVWSGEIGVAVGESPEGPFTEALGEPLVSADDKPEAYEGPFYNIDPAAFIDSDGRSYLYWGNGACFVAELHEEMTSFVSAIQQVEITDHQGYAEGPFVWERHGIYYLLYSQGGGRSYDRLDYATSEIPLGPYQYRGTIVDHGKKGNIHGSVFQFHDQWYVAYHDLFPTDKYRKTCIERIHYDREGNIIRVSPTRAGVGWYNAIETVEAEDFFESSGCIIQDWPGDSIDFSVGLTAEDWIKFPNVKLPFDFSSQWSVTARHSGATAYLDLVLDSLRGQRIGELRLEYDPGRPSWKVTQVQVDSIFGSHDIYIIARSKGNIMVQIDKFRLY